MSLMSIRESIRESTTTLSLDNPTVLTTTGSDHLYSTSNNIIIFSFYIIYNYISILFI